MKTKSRNLLTVILAMLCAVAIALGVSFVLPKNESITADATTNAVSYTGQGMQYFQSVSAGVVSPTVATYSDFSAADSTYGSTTFSGGTNTAGATAIKNSAKDAVIYYFDICASIDVPAYTEYTVVFTMGATISRVGSGGVMYDMVYFGDTNRSSTLSFGYAQCSSSTGENYSSGGGFGTQATYSFSDKTQTEVLTNNTESTVTKNLYFGFMAGTGRNTDGAYGMTANATITNTVEVTKLSAPTTMYTTPETYDGNLKTFDFTYFTTTDYTVAYKNIVPTVDAVDFDGNSIDTTNPSKCKIDILDGSGLPTSVTGSLKATEAGTYTVKFNLTSDAISHDVTWSDGSTNEQTLTFTINRKEVTVPTIANKTATYDATNGTDFAVTNFDSTAMTAEIVPSTSTDISWVVGGTKFNATKVGTYTVKFKIDSNHVWDDGTATDRMVTLKVEPKKLNVPTITNPQEYTGSAMTFTLSNDYDTTAMKTDSATGTGSNTVTGPGGAAIANDTKSFEATNIGKYTVTLSLKDTTNYRWSDSSITVKNVQFEITQKELISTAIACSSVNGVSNAEWGFGDSTVIVTITDDRMSGDAVDLFIYYDNKSHQLTTVTTVGNVTTVTMPSDISVGSHTLYVELNGSTGVNANYKITKNNTLAFEVTTGKIDPSSYGWIYTVDGVAGSTISDGDKVPFALKAGSTTDGVKYELSIQIPTSAASSVVVDTSKYASGYQLRTGDKVGLYTTTVALKSIDSDLQFEVNGNKQDTIDVTINWEIEKGDFDLSGVKWEYTTDNGKTWTEYDSANPPQYNDGNYVTVRVKASTLPLGLTLDSMYDGDGERTVGNSYTAYISASDLVYNTSNFNAPNTSALTLNWEIAKKNLFNGFTNSKEPYSNANYSGSIILKKLKFSDPKFEDYVEYKYYDLKTGLEVTLDNIKDLTDPTDEKKYKVEAYIKPEYSANYDVLDSGNVPQDQFKTGSKNVLATATVDGKDGSTPITVGYDGNDHFDKSVIKVVGDDGLTITDYTVTYYKGKTPVAGNELAAGELPKDAGDYCIEIVLGPVAEAGYILGDDWFTVTVEAKGIALPELSEMVFNGKELNFVDFLKGDGWTTYGPAGLDIIKVDGKLSDRNVGAGNYVTTLTITDTNYKWIYPNSKSLTKYSRASEVKVTGDDVEANYNWNITPLIVDTTNMWNKGKTGATLNLPQNIRDFIAGGTLDLGYRYYDNEGNFIEEPELKGGKSFRVEAVFGGDDAERNIVFKTGDNEFGAVSKGIDYTVPQSGAAAFFGNVKDALTTSYAGLPLWAWLLIALALLILLIIIIVVACKRRKSKEEKEEIKAAKEEEKRLKEEERQRREEEREEERRRREEERAEEKRRREEELEHERELAKARQEAELEKIRAQAQVASAGAATMAVAQQPAQQVPSQPEQPVQQIVYQYPQPQMQQVPVPVPVPQPQYYPQPMYPQYPMMQQMPMQMPMPQYGGGSANAPSNYEDARLLLAEERARTAESRLAEERARAAEEKSYRSMEERALLAEERFVRGGGSVQQAPVNQILPAPAPAPAPAAQTGNMNPDFIGAVIAAALRNSGVSPAAVVTTLQNAAEPQPAEEKTVSNAPTMYPSDAVITTTTTVDTTKNKPIRTREEETNFDVDGFYDKFE